MTNAITIHRLTSVLGSLAAPHAFLLRDTTSIAPTAVRRTYLPATRYHVPSLPCIAYRPPLPPYSHTYAAGYAAAPRPWLPRARRVLSKRPSATRSSSALPAALRAPLEEAATNQSTTTRPTRSPCAWARRLPSNSLSHGFSPGWQTGGAPRPELCRRRSRTQRAGWWE